MLKETMTEILEAEKKAKEMVDAAMTEAKMMNENAVKEAEAIKTETVKNVKDERSKVVSLANKESEEEFESIVLSGKSEGEALIKNTDTTKAVDFIKRRIFDKYGNS